MEQRRTNTRALVILLALMLTCGVLAVVGGYQLLNRPRSLVPTLVLPTDLFPEPTPTIYPSEVTVIEQVQMLGRLETISYHIEKVVTAETGQGPLGFLLGDKLLLIARGTVIAGVDLTQVGPEDVLITGDGTVYFHLPKATVFMATLDNQRTEVYDRRTGLVGMNPQLETAARQQAELLIREAAEEYGVVEKADENARQVMRSLFVALRLEHVIFVDVLPTLTPSPTPLPSATPTVTP